MAPRRTSNKRSADDAEDTNPAKKTRNVGVVPQDSKDELPVFATPSATQNNIEKKASINNALPVMSTAPTAALTKGKEKATKDIVTLTRVRYCKSDDWEAPPDMINLAYAFNTDTAARLVSLDTRNLNSPALVNLGIADPADFEKSASYLTLKGHAKPTRFFTIGVTTRDSTLFTGNKARGICIVPSGVTFPRAIVVASKVFGREPVIVPTFRGAVSFSSYKKTASSIPSPGKIRGTPTKVNPQLTWGSSAVLNWDEDVPTYDGRETFDPLTYRSLKPILNELEPKSGVVVVFTVSHYKAKETVDSVKGWDFALSLNIQEVILVADPDNSVDNGELVPACKELGLEPANVKEEIEDPADPVLV